MSVFMELVKITHKKTEVVGVNARWLTADSVLGLGSKVLLLNPQFGQIIVFCAILVGLEL